jgi:capsular exopolysaccharide synthesis family protein
MLRRGRAARVDFLRIIEESPELAQAYEALAINLRVAGRPEPMRTLLIASCAPSEGKTTTAVGLAVALARFKKRTLLIEADLRRPSVHRLLPVHQEVGVTSLLPGKAADGTLRHAVQSVEIPEGPEEDSCELSVVTSGPLIREALRAIESGLLADAMAKAAREFDVIIVDSPPILSVGDALLLAPAVDGVVLVLRAGEVTSRDARNAKETLERSGARVVGVVMNQFDESEHGPAALPYRARYSLRAGANGAPASQGSSD